MGTSPFHLFLSKNSYICGKEKNFEDMKIRHIIFAVLLAVFAVSCVKKQTPIDRLTQLNEKLDQKDAKYTEEEWVALGEEIEEIEDEVRKNKDQYTEEELREIGRLKGKALGKIAKKAVNDFAGEIGNFLKESDGLLEGFKEALQEK